MKNPFLIYATFDLQAILTLPFAGECQIYYERKLSMYNFTIFDSRRMRTCYTWDKNNRKKEVSRFVLVYFSILRVFYRRLLKLFSMQTLVAVKIETKKSLRFCYMLLMLLQNTSIESIDLKFIQSGHSAMEADSMHGAIERAKKGYTE